MNLSLLKFIIIQILFPILFGLVIYSFRSNVPANLDMIISPINHHIKIPNWILFNLSDALWNYSFFSCILLIRINDELETKIIWLSMALIISFIFEFLQKYNFIPGYFDLLDLLFMFASIIIWIIISIS